jgi:outer membrane protein assembly factor BamB
MLVLVLPALALTLSACDWPEFGLYNHGSRDSADTGISLSNVASTKLDWTATTGAAVVSSPAVVNGVVYVGSIDGNVYALNATSGATLWTGTTGGGVDSSPAVANGVVYIGSNDDKVYAFKP